MLIRFLGYPPIVLTVDSVDEIASLYDYYYSGNLVVFGSAAKLFADEKSLQSEQFKHLLVQDGEYNVLTCVWGEGYERDDLCCLCIQ